MRELLRNILIMALFFTLCKCDTPITAPWQRGAPFFKYLRVEVADNGKCEEVGRKSITEFIRQCEFASFSNSSCELNFNSGGNVCGCTKEEADFNRLGVRTGCEMRDEGCTEAGNLFIFTTRKLSAEITTCFQSDTESQFDPTQCPADCEFLVRAKSKTPITATSGVKTPIPDEQETGTTNSSSNIGIIIGIAAGVVALLGVLLALIIYVLRKRKRKPGIDQSTDDGKVHCCAIIQNMNPSNKNTNVNTGSPDTQIVGDGNRLFGSRS